MLWFILKQAFLSLKTTLIYVHFEANFLELQNSTDLHTWYKFVLLLYCDLLFDGLSLLISVLDHWLQKDRLWGSLHAVCNQVEEDRSEYLISEKEGTDNNYLDYLSEKKAFLKAIEKLTKEKQWW